MDYTVPDATFRAILHDIAAALATRPAGAVQHDRATAGLDQPSAESNTHHLSLALNALADWGSKQVALRDRAPSTALPPNTLSAGRWCLVDVPQPAPAGSAAVCGAVQQSDPSSVRRLVTTRVERAMQEARLHPNASDEQPTRLNMSNLWVEESTAVLRRPSGKQAGNQAAMPMEQLTKHYCQMAYGSTLYNADALAKDPDLAAAHVRGPKSKQTAHSIHTARSAPFKWAHHP
jgi:hypothetical protein